MVFVWPSARIQACGVTHILTLNQLGDGSLADVLRYGLTGGPTM
jgi:hypothetical protein